VGWEMVIRDRPTTMLPVFDLEWRSLEMELPIILKKSAHLAAG